DARDDRAALAAALAAAEATGRPVPDGIAFLDAPLSRLGGYVWAYDDDGAGHPPAVPDPVWAELRSSARRQPPRELRLQCFGPPSPMLEALAAAEVPATHLIVSAPTDALIGAEAPPPGLLALTGTRAVLGPWLREPASLAALEALTLTGGGAPLDALRALPALRHLGVWFGTRGELLSLLVDPLVAHLETLDLWSIRPPAPFAELLERRSALAHLRRRFLPGHRVSAEVRAAFAHWPNVRFVGFDRREVLGHDLLRIGYPRALR
ncbi:MAG TPA: hypothetical protein RMI62_24325, partial [Polyangiaceae bacterium LLY-WYZ-15_(1-7)]|nr:hypothetical protein [Polyangiaceae bacterium LLY-WYZ-15_(1-7)]